MILSRNDNVNDRNDLEVGHLYPFSIHFLSIFADILQDIEVDGGVKVHTVDEAAKVAVEQLLGIKWHK
jgi:hypothetical protein